MKQMPIPIGSHTFADGSTRTVYQDAAGRQFVLDNDNRLEFGDWLTRQEVRPEVVKTSNGD